jgi:hypothetical protein
MAHNILHVVFFSKKTLLALSKTIDTQKSNKRLMAETIIGETKKEGHRKAKR